MAAVRLVTFRIPMDFGATELTKRFRCNISPLVGLNLNPEMTNGQRSSDPRAVLTNRHPLWKGFFMAARDSIRVSHSTISQAVQHAAQGQPSAIRGGLVPRTIYFPTGFLSKVENEPGGLVALLTLALSAYTKGGAQ